VTELARDLHVLGQRLTLRKLARGVRELRLEHLVEGLINRLNLPGLAQ